MRILPKRSKKILITFLFSYISILLVPIAFGSIVYIKAGNVIEDEVSNAKLGTLIQASTAIDTRIAEIHQRALQAASNPNIQDISHKTTLLNQDDRREIYDILMNIQPYRIDDSFTEEFYIYFKNSDIIMTSSSMYSPESFYNFYSIKDIPYSEWHNKIKNQPYAYREFTVQDMIANNNPKRMINYTQTVPPNQIINPSAFLNVLIDESKINNILNSVAAGGFAYIVDDKNNILSRTEQNDFNFIIDHELIPNKKGIIRQKIDGSDFVVTYTSSSVTGWKYVVVVPHSVFMNKMKYIKNITLWVVGLCFIIGTIVAYILAYKNYYPIERIVDAVSFLDGSSPSRGKNEFEYIHSSVVTALNKNLQLEQKIINIRQQYEKIDSMVNKNGTMIKNSLISNLIKGKIDNSETINSLLSFYNISLVHESFVVILFQINDYKAFVGDENDKELEILRFAIKSIANELINNCYSSYSTDLENDTVALLINFSNKNKITEIKKQLSGISYEFKEVFEEHFKVMITIGIGCIQMGIANINLSFNQAKSALDYRIVKGNSSVISYDEIVDEDKDYYYPISDELQLINFIKVGDIKTCMKLLKNIFNENFNKRTLSLKLAKCLFFDVMSTAIKVLDTTKVNYTDIFGSEFDPIDKLSACETFKQIYDDITFIYNKICEHINESRNNHNNGLKDAILVYINENFTNENLCQTSIADEFGITAPYLSKFFKNEIGENMIDYLNKLRINKVKYYLANTDLSLVEIAHEVGVGSNKTLIRVFKQYEGITPGNYRNNLFHKEEQI